VNDEERPSLMSFDIEPAPADTPPLSLLSPVALDGFAHGIDPLDALVVVSLGDGVIHGAWVRGDAGLSAADVAACMREAYRTSLQASRKLALYAVNEGAKASEPLVTIETPGRIALLKRIRAYVVACLFDASIPLGMARLCAARLYADLEPELPLTDLERLTLPPPSAAPTAPAPAQPASVPAARRSVPIRAPHAPASEVERARRLIAHAEANLPDAHTVRLRLALRAHTSRLSLDHPEALPSEAILRIETAVLEMLGIEREQLSAMLADGVRA
jgi:hypothetical protein